MNKIKKLLTSEYLEILILLLCVLFIAYQTTSVLFFDNNLGVVLFTTYVVLRIVKIIIYYFDKIK